MDLGVPPAIYKITNAYNSQTGCVNNPQLRSRSTLATVTKQLSESTFKYDGYNSITDQIDYDWVSNGSAGAKLRETKTTYLTGAYVGRGVNLVHLPQTQTILSGTAETQIAYTIFNYDEYGSRALVNEAGITGHDSSYGTGYSTRGNLTTVWQSQTGSNTVNIASAEYTFDIAGNIVAQYDGDGNETQFACNDGGGTYALPISATNALNQTTQASYDYNILQPVSTTDINGNGTSYSYNDALDRLTNVTLPTNAKTTYSYPSTTERDVYQDQASSGDQALHTRQLFDGLGRLTETDGYESSSGYIATTQRYDAMGRVATSTNPSRAGDGLNYATSYAYDSLNRITKVTTADGSTATTSYSGNQTTMTDAMGHARQSTQDGLGRMTQVVEDPGSSPHLAYTTNYTFDGAGDLTSVTQGAQTRTPALRPSWLGRLEAPRWRIGSWE